ncbi:hypothetical protein GCM10007242_16740 [Pigmentiphaga litoralis]|uniref:hypothetical protein n=1 Tax=Pigmentiphaga litoralis TaxID=516702 RepID=UPI001679668C|nr:hypothetical protein [Pigmentiphaga litoralis]GGX11295.1 hypothetical protein GCM10007242_16740 [Pigmentiphaga litoralis]
MDIFASRCAIAEEAEKAAIARHWEGEPYTPATPNPFPEGSDAHHVWAVNFNSKLSALQRTLDATC